MKNNVGSSALSASAHLHWRGLFACLFALLMGSQFALAGNEDEQRGAELLKPFKQQLMGALKAGMASGPAEAVAACQLQAPGIAHSLSTDGIRIGRTSHRLRNPANTAPDWVSPVLEEWLADDARRSPRTVELSEDSLGYVEPIGIKPMCLTCHGTALAPDVAARIAELYPEDQATGFSEGDLRGVFWVEYPAGD